MVHFKMRILHITPTYYPATYWGGPIFSVYALNNALAALPDIELKVLTTNVVGHPGCTQVGRNAVTADQASMGRSL